MRHRAPVWWGVLAGTSGVEVVRAHIEVAICESNLGNFPRAIEIYEHATALARELGDEGGFLALAQDRVDDASTALRESLSICRAENLQELIVWPLEGLAAVSLARTAPVPAARLLAATTSLREKLALGDYYPIGDEVRERSLAAARKQLSAGEVATAWTEGSDLSAEAAAEEAALVD